MVFFVTRRRKKAWKAFLLVPYHHHYLLTGLNLQKEVRFSDKSVPIAMCVHVWKNNKKVNFSNSHYARTSLVCLWSVWNNYKISLEQLIIITVGSIEEDL